jgi:hypothetical protein
MKILILVLLLAACGGPSATPQKTQQYASQPATEIVVVEKVVHEKSKRPMPLHRHNQKPSPEVVVIEKKEVVEKEVVIEKETVMEVVVEKDSEPDKEAAPEKTKEKLRHPKRDGNKKQNDVPGKAMRDRSLRRGKNPSKPGSSVAEETAPAETPAEQSSSADGENDRVGAAGRARPTEKNSRNYGKPKPARNRGR